MRKVAVVYWSGTGNTEAMAVKVVEGAKAVGADVSIFTSDVFNSEMINQFDGIAFGCPSMGAEQLEESEFEPMFNECKSKLGGKRIALFGSYGWGDGEWMRDWTERMKKAGAVLVRKEGVIANDAPDEEALAECRAAGKELAAV